MAESKKGAHHGLPRRFILPTELVEEVAEQGFDFLPDLIFIVKSLEQVCLEIRRRTREDLIFPNGDSCLCLVSAVPMEIIETWETGRIYHLKGVELHEHWVS